MFRQDASGLSRLAGRTVPTWAPGWAAKAHLDAKLGSPGAPGLQVELPRRTSLPSKACPDAILVPNLASKCLPRAPRTSNFAHPYDTLATFSIIACFAVRVLLDCFLAGLLALLGAFWPPLGASWAPLGLHLGPLGRLLDSTWASWVPLGLRLGPLGASWLHFGTSWAPLGLNSGPFGHPQGQIEAEVGAK